MHDSLEFPALLQLIDERSAAFRAAIASAPSLDVQVPTCPDWTLFDLAEHIGEGRRSWAATVAAGPDATGKVAAPGAPTAPRERVALLDWLAESTKQLGEALEQAGPDRGCWTWWDTSQSPQTCGAVARHQLQQLAVHTYDAQVTLGARQPLPEEVALDGVEEFLHTCCATTSAWPHEPAVVDYEATEGRSWRVWLSTDGARAARRSQANSLTDGENAGPADAVAKGTASDLVLFLYGRPVDSVTFDGDPEVFDRLFAWDPGE